ncbi:MAG: cation transporter [Sporolactobacillus sp.]
MATWIFCAAIAVGLIFAGQRTIRSLRAGCCGSGGCVSIKKIDAADTDPSHYPFHKKIQIEGMHCRACTVRVQNALNQLSGVTSEVALREHEATIHTMEDMSDKKLRAIIARAGYRAVSIHNMTHA